MGSLSELAAKQKEAQRNATATRNESQPAPVRRFGTAAPRSDAGDVSKGRTESVPSPAEAAQVATGNGGESKTPISSESTAAPARRFGAAGSGGNSGNLVARTAAATPAVSKPAPVESTLNSLDDLAGFEGGEAIVEAREAHPTSLEGETDATAPTRELPADMTDSMKGFVEQLDNLYEVLFDAELFGNYTKNIMIELQENPEYIKLIADKDIHTMIRGMRDSMGLARIKKVESKRGTGARKGKVTASVAEAVDALGAMFNESDF